MVADLRFALELLKMTLKSVASQRNSMLLRAFFAFTNHAIYIPVWLVIFSVSPDIQGWTLQHVFLTYAMSMCCWGIVFFTAFGLRTIPDQIDHGEFDAYLTLPKPVLLSAAISSSKNTGVGDFLFGCGLLIFCHFHFGVSLALMPFFIVMGCVVLASAVLFFATLGFWLRQFYGSAEEIYFNFSLLATRPAPIYTGVFKVIALTVVPVSLMAQIPVEFIFTHQWPLLAFGVIGTIAYATLAIAFFHVGLRHYESGNRFGVRG